MRFLLRMVPSDPDIVSATRVVRGIAASMGGKAVNAKTTSYGALEVDVFVESRADFDVFLAAVEPLGKLEFYKDLQEPPRFLPTVDAVAEAISLFNAERFWEAHEILESVWRVAEGEEKRLLQGLILVCAALVHLQKGETQITFGVISRAIAKLVWDGKYYGIDIDELRKMMARMLEEKRVTVFKF